MNNDPDPLLLDITSRVDRNFYFELARAFTLDNATCGQAASTPPSIFSLALPSLTVRIFQHSHVDLPSLYIFQTSISRSRTAIDHNGQLRLFCRRHHSRQRHRMQRI